MSKKFHRLIFIAIILIAIAIAFYFSHTSTNKNSIDVVKAKTAIESQVIRVVDGDTIIVAINHKPETIRLLGINTPETVKPNWPVECYGPEASTHVKKTLTDEVVRLESDPSQDDRDKYHRLLRYVFLKTISPSLERRGPGGGQDETLLRESFVNESLVRAGYAREYTFKVPYKYQKQFRADQKLAKKNKVGLWGKCK